MEAVDEGKCKGGYRSEGGKVGKERGKNTDRKSGVGREGHNTGCPFRVSSPSLGL